jgi:crotonobetainyl-CoA:carnitine CoA-transferase CaiB-like acyl-CoA transferase
LALLGRADVFLTSFTPVRRARLGLDTASLRAVNQRLIDASASAAGTGATTHDLPGFSSVAYWARGGIGMAVTAPGDPYVPQPAGFPDACVATTLGCGITAALYQRERTGRGCSIDVSLLGTAVWQMALELLLPPTSPHQPKVDNPLAAAYRCADERFIVLAMHREGQWSALCAALGRPGLAVDDRFSTVAARMQNAEMLRSVLGAAFALYPHSYWERELAERGCTFGTAQTVEELRRDPLVLAGGFLLPHPEHADTLLAVTPIAHDSILPPVRSRAPRRGEHSAEILATLGRK